MLTSHQAAAIMQQQQAQAAMLQGQPMGPMPQPMPGPSSYPPAFNYGLNPTQTLTGAGGLSAPIVGGVGALPGMLGGIGAAAGVGSIFAPGSAMLGRLSMMDPFMAAWRGGSMGYGMAAGGGMAGVGMAAGGALAGAGLVAGTIGLGMYSGRQFVGGAQEQQALNAQLSGIGFANPFSATGRGGFGYRQMTQIGSMMREFESADPFTSMRDMNQMMDRFNQQGLAQGVQNAREFAEKFTRYVDTMRDMATTLGTTLDEATQTFGQMRQAGFYTAQDVMGNTFNMMAARGMGMEADVFHGMQAGSSSITRQALMSGRAGALTSSRFAQSLLLGATERGSGGLGLFSGEELMDITGAATQGEAAGMMGQQFTGTLTQFLRGTGTGRAFLAAVGEQDGGRFTGGIDLSRVAGAGIDDLSLLGGAQLRTGGQKASFTTNEHSIASSVLESEEGVDAALSMIEETARKHFRGTVHEDDAVQMFLKHVLNMDKLQAEKVAEFMEHREELRSAHMARLRQEQAASAFQLELRRNRTFGGLEQRVRGTVSDTFAPIKQAGADMGTYFDVMGQNVEDSVFGVERYHISQGARRDALMGMITGNAYDPALTQLGTEDYGRGSVSREMSRMLGPGVASGIRGRAMTGSLNFSDFGGLGPTSQSHIVDSMLDETKNQEVNRILARLQNARARGDEGAIEAETQALRNYIKNNVMVGGVSWEGNVDQAMAFVAHLSGDDTLAKELILEGGGETTAYGDVKSAKKKAYEAARAAGLSPELAEQLSSGGEGSSLVAKLGAMEKAGALGEGKRAFSYLDDLKQSNVRRLAGLEGDAYYGELAAILSEQGVGDFTSGDVRAAEEMLGSIQARTKKVGGDTGIMIGGGLRGSTGGKTVVTAGQGDVALELSGLAGEALGAAVQHETMTAARAQIAMAPPEVQAVLGAELDKLSGALSGDPDPATVSAALEGIASKAAKGGLTGMAGGKELASIGARRKEAMGASVPGIGRLYGLGEDEDAILAAIGGMGIAGVDVSDGLGQKEKEAAVKALSQMDVLASMGAGGGGGIFMRGETPEQAMMLQLGMTAVKVREMSESVDKMVRTVDESPFLSFWGTSETE